MARGQEPKPVCEVEAELTVDLEGESVEGEALIRLRNDGPTPAGELPLVLYPNRFRELDPAITDIAWDRFYPWWFDEGGLDLVWVRDGRHAPLAWQDLPLPGLPALTAITVALPAPVAPGRTIEVRVRWRIHVPSRLGTFGIRSGRLVADGGLLPYVPERDPVSGERDPRLPPVTARMKLAVREGTGARIVLDRRLVASGDVAAIASARSPSLLVGDDLEPLLEVPPQGDAPGIRVLGEEGDEDRAGRIARTAQSAGSWMRRKGWIPANAPPLTITFAPAPLRDRLVQVCEGPLVLYSDRLMHVFPLLRGFHEAEVGRGTIESMVNELLVPEPLGADRDWVAEAVSWVAAREWVNDRGGLTGGTIRRALGWIDVIPAVDRLLRAPKFAAADVYYGRFYESWFDVPDEFQRALWRRQRGRVVAEKLREKLGQDPVTGLLHETVGLAGAPGPSFRTRAAVLAGEELTPFLQLWLGPLPKQNLRIADVEVLEELEEGEKIRIRIRREGDPRVGQVGEPVDVESEDPDGEKVRARWDGKGDEGEVVMVTDDGWLRPIVLDPDSRVFQAYRGDDERPRLAKLLFNRFKVRVDVNQANKNEVALGMTIHPFYDYSQAIVLDGFFQEDERGITVGYGYGFGTVIDERTYSTGVSARFSASRLNDDVLDDDLTLAGIVETEGALVSAGLGFSFDTRLYQQDPTWGFEFDILCDFADRWFGTDFRYAAVAGEVGFVMSPWRGTTLGVEIEMGQVEGRLVPTQRLFDAGGESTIRGVEGSDFLDRALICIQTELRQTIITDLDIPILWVAWLRKLQLAAFFDMGDVGESIEAVFEDREHWKYGAGGGIRIFLDAFGVNPVVARFDVGIRLDDRDDADPQFYFGLGQSF